MLGALLPVSLHLESCTRAWDMGTGNALSCMRMHGEVRWWVVLLAMAHGGGCECRPHLEPDFDHVQRPHDDA